MVLIGKTGTAVWKAGPSTYVVQMATNDGDAAVTGSDPRAAAMTDETATELEAVLEIDVYICAYLYVSGFPMEPDWA